MDKYTYSLKVEKIQKLVRQEDYEAAAKIADTMDWEQEHNVRLLTAVAEAYEKSGQYTQAIDVLLTAYEHSAIGKRIMYQLTELALKAGVHPDTLGRWLKRHQHTLEALGLLPGMRLLPPKVVK